MSQKRTITVPEAPPTGAIKSSKRANLNEGTTLQIGHSRSSSEALNQTPPPLPLPTPPPAPIARSTPQRSCAQNKPLPPELMDLHQEFIVKMGGFFLGEKFRLSFQGDSLIFVSLKSGKEVIFDPKQPYHDFTLRNPWTSGSDEHVIIETKKRERFAFTIPVKAWPTLRDWWKRMKP